MSQRRVLEWQVVYQRDGRCTKRLHGGDEVLFLKTAPDLRAERDRLRWLGRHLPAPPVLGFRPGDPDLLLTRAGIGRDLTDDNHRRKPVLVVQLLAAALRRLHGIDPDTCPFGRQGPGLVVVHGDACLPNFLATGERITGYLDVGELRIDRAEVDLAAAVWSLQHNLGPGWGPPSSTPTAGPSPTRTPWSDSDSLTRVFDLIQVVAPRTEKGSQASDFPPEASWYWSA
ncbi:phosphotransferase [Microlunatus parietis]|uniref:Aminoglycoside 3'-phosphotransferase-2 n=1 Tax=Microlunatus parietis TaxID=682979 RepID=A0A7Y9IDR9_9ACTN|nr:phosphotransferase [Microlunatus parietis]NYE74949.1 aminoglycoside 3'-phosphotransferase-2 [Microlunatus parietis]